MGTLAAIGLLWIITSIAVNTTGIPGVCIENHKSIFADPSPSGERTLITTLTYCESGDMRLLLEQADRSTGNAHVMLTEDGHELSTYIYWESDSEATVAVGGDIDYRFPEDESKWEQGFTVGNPYDDEVIDLFARLDDR